MKGEDLLFALNNVEAEMIENAEEFAADTCVRRRNYRVAVAVVMLMVICIVVGGKALLKVPEQQSGQVISVPIYELGEDVCQVYYLTSNDTEASQKEDYGYPYILSDADVFQLNLSAIKGFADSFSGQTKGKAHCSLRLTEAFRAAEKKIEAGHAKEGEIKYLVTIDINEAVLSQQEYGLIMESYQPVNVQVMQAEYERLTEEYGYELTWIPNGGYQVAEDYWYYLETGGMYGILTEEEIRNFPVKEEYSYLFLLTCYESLEYTKCAYKESCKQEEIYRAQQIAQEALRQLEAEED